MNKNTKVAPKFSMTDILLPKIISMEKFNIEQQSFS
jgi:hypothetical protein